MPLDPGMMSYADYLQTRSQDAARMARQLLYDISTVSTSANPSLLEVGFVGLAIIAIISLYLIQNSLRTSRATKVQSHLVKWGLGSIESRNGSLQKGKLTNDKNGVATMEVSQLWVYPIKALRGCQISAATLTREGFSYDRKFVLLRDLGTAPRGFQHMAVTAYPTVCLFHTSIRGDTLTVNYKPPGATGDNVKYLDIPLQPSNFQKLDKVEINMHSSPTVAYDLGQHYNQWFSDIFGFKVVLAYWGGNPRQVLGNLPGKAPNVSSKPMSFMSSILRQIPLVGSALIPEDWVIAFNDVAPFLIITEESAADVTTRLPGDVEVDITKFRANIILKKSSCAYDEDFWGELIFGDGAKIILTGNCGRCASLNIDYNTAKSGTGKDGMVLKLLSRDRRVDQGYKYSPIFGRYGFTSMNSEGKTLAVGDEVVVGKRNTERTTFYWPGIST